MAFDHETSLILLLMMPVQTRRGACQKQMISKSDWPLMHGSLLVAAASNIAHGSSKAFPQQFEPVHKGQTLHKFGHHTLVHVFNKVVLITATRAMLALL